MFKKLGAVGVCVVMALLLFSATGRDTIDVPDMGIHGYPIPVSPYFEDDEEGETCERERCRRVPVLGPVTADGPVKALDPPSEEEVLRALEKAYPIEGGLPLLHEVEREDVRIDIEPIADYVDPPRVYPLIGPAQQHHAHYKCTIHYTEVTRCGWPLPYAHTDENAKEVIYIDHTHLHMIGDADDRHMW